MLSDKSIIIGYTVGGGYVMALNRNNYTIAMCNHYNYIEGLFYGIEDVKINNITQIPLNGKESCDRMYAQSTSSFPSVNYCRDYNPNGFRKGKWFVPSASELYLFGNNMSQMRSDISTAGVSSNIIFSNGSRPWINYWSSTPCRQTGMPNRFFVTLMCISELFNNSIDRVLGYKSGEDFCNVIPFLKL